MAVFPLSLPVPLPDALELATRDTIEPVIAGDALAAILAERLDQLARGHTPDRDRDAPLLANLKMAREYITRATDAADLDKDRRDLPRALKKAAQAAALCMAAMDRIAHEIETERQNAVYAEVLIECDDAGSDDIATPPLAFAPPDPDGSLAYFGGSEQVFGDVREGDGFPDGIDAGEY